MKLPSASMSAVRRSFSDCDPSHHTIFDGLVRRADSSTQLSSGVDTLSPELPTGPPIIAMEASSAGCAEIRSSLIAIKNFRVGRWEMQGRPGIGVLAGSGKLTTRFCAIQGGV